MKKLFIKGMKRVKRSTSPASYPAHPLIGKLVSFEDGQKGRLVSLHDDMFCVKLAIPDRDGTLVITDSQIMVEEVEKFDGIVSKECKVRAFESIIPFKIEGKALHLRDDDDIITDFKSVKVIGLASTFKVTTPRDRDGDFVADGAFDKTLADFRRNPVMLIDHRNSVSNLVGSFSKIGVIPAGLAVEGDITDAPDMRSVRFKIMEGHLKAFSIGGLFRFGDDPFEIVEVDLFEISMIPVPANPDALFTTRSLDIEDCIKCFKHYKEKVWR